jgi:hypothetical protein
LPRRIGLMTPSLLGPGSLSLALHRILEMWDVAAGDSTPELVRSGPPRSPATSSTNACRRPWR